MMSATTVRDHNGDIELVHSLFRVEFTELNSYMKRETQRSEKVQKWFRHGVIYLFSKGSEVAVKGSRTPQWSISYLFEECPRQEPSPVHYCGDVPDPVMSGGEDLLSNAVVTVRPLPRRGYFEMTAEC